MVLKAPQDFHLDPNLFVEEIEFELAGHKFTLENPRLSYHFTQTNEGRAVGSHPPGRGLVNEATLFIVINKRTIDFGDIPVPVCDRAAAADDIPGFFRINGKDILIRKHLVVRKNYPVFFKNKILFRAVNDQLTSRGLSFRDDGIQITVRIGLGSIDSIALPAMLLLIAVGKTNEKVIAKDILQGLEDREDIKLYVLKCFRCNDCKTPKAAKEFIQSSLTLLKTSKREEIKYKDVIRNVMIQCTNNRDKYNALVLCVRRFLYAKFKLVPEESLDFASVLELTTTSDYFSCMIRERLKSLITNAKTLAVKLIEDKVKKQKEEAEKQGRSIGDDYKAILSKEEALDIFHLALNMKKEELSKQMIKFISVGNSSFREINGCQETTGITNIVEVNNRQGYIAQFFKVAKGSSYQNMKVSDMRQIQPYTKGFICIIESPDGAQCGLILFLCKECQITTQVKSERDEVQARLNKCRKTLGIQIRLPDCPKESKRQEAAIVVDGIITGYVDVMHAVEISEYLRKKKKIILDENGLLKNAWEVAYGPRNWHGPETIYVFTTSGRMMRPIHYGPTQDTLFIGSLEALNFVIRNKCDVPLEDMLTTTREIDDKNMFGHIANFIPFSNHNPGPRVIYQCQMMKQAMGTPSLGISDRLGPSKLLRLETPIKPLVRPQHWSDMRMDEYPQGQNCIVALMPFEGMNMEDSIILNKSSVQRGLFHAHQFSYEIYHLKDLIPKKASPSRWCFGFPLNALASFPPLEAAELKKELTSNGFPHLRRLIGEHERLFAYYYTDSKTKVEDIRFVKKKKKSGMRVINYRVFNEGKSLVLLTSYPRIPVVGDKFANRAGQKGVCSMLVEEQDLPYFPSLGGVRPDVIFNPHGLASRMTAGMLLEAIAGVVAINDAEVIDASAFRTYEENGQKKDPFDYFNDMLERAGMPRGSEHMAINGALGEPIDNKIMVGMIHYQRLRQMVEDKQQARTRKGYDRFTWQPQHGRELGGGLRYGEMERDTLLAHGTSDLLIDRTMYQSDLTLAFYCSTCGCVFSNSYCWQCGAESQVTKVLVPAAFMRMLQMQESVGLQLVFRE
ncbi:DNA-directed RNA polymerase I subunit rpa2-like isoform X2 [Artemia franciscana]|uniref:DNA-directed RNA polymerase I subunit rpa2-like isoform X2 n=1 Tax=Artemia franciscana TaxID=6661 RepID=UPI0032DB628B